LFGFVFAWGIHILAEDRAAPERVNAHVSSIPYGVLKLLDADTAKVRDYLGEIR